MSIERIKAYLEKLGIAAADTIVYNPSFSQLRDAELDPKLQGYEKGVLTNLGAVNVDTGIYTGRSPKDKYIVMDDTTRDTFWWNTPESPNDNKALTLGRAKSAGYPAAIRQTPLYSRCFLRRQ